MNISGGMISIIAISAGIAILLFIAWIFLKRPKETDLFENMEGAEFETFCAELLKRNGFDHIDLTPQSRDYGIDILAMKEGISYAIQCKCYSEPVGIKAVQEAYAGKAYYGCMLAVVMTNQGFTKNAFDFAERLNVVLWDGKSIEKMQYSLG